MGRKLLLGLLLLAPLGFYPLLRGTTAIGIPEPPKTPPNPLSEQEQLAMHCFAALPGQHLGCVPWEALRQIAADQSQAMDALAVKDPVKLLEIGLAKYGKEVQGYRCTFEKREVVKGTERDNEIIRVCFREKPFSVLMQWKEGVDQCFASLYVKGQNDGKLAARSRIPGLGIPGPILDRPVDGADAKAASRFGIDKFGIYLGAKDTLDAIHKAKKDGTLHLSYKGIEPVEKAGGRMCYKFVRTPYEPPEEAEGLNELIIYIDRATLLQVGSELRDDKGKFIAEYYFRDIEINPVFDEKQFTKKAL